MVEYRRFDLKTVKKCRLIKWTTQWVSPTCRVHTFEEEIEFVQGLNHSTGKNIGISANQTG